MSYTYGCDVSKYQSVSDWAPLAVKNRWEFIIARASISLSTDATFDNHIAKAKAMGMLTGAYHFNDLADASPEKQADLFCQRIDAVGGVDFPNLDVEGTGKMTVAQAKRFIDRMHANGKRCGLYMSASQYYWGIGQDWDWIAKWTLNQTPPPNPPSGAWKFWQYTSNGKSTDATRIDLDVFNGTLTQLKTLAGGTMSVLNIEQEFDPAIHILIKTGRVSYDLDGGDPNTVSGDITRVCAALVQIPGKDSSHWYVARLPGGPPGANLRLVHKVDAEVLPEPEPQADQIALLSDELEKAQSDLEKAQIALEDAAEKERERIANAEAARIKSL